MNEKVEGNERFIAKLLVPDGTDRRKVAEEIVDQFLNYRLGEILDIKQNKSIILNIMKHNNIEMTFNTYIVPGIEMLSSVLKTCDDKVGDFVPELVKNRMVLVGKKAEPRLRWMQSMIDKRLLNQLLAPVFQDFITAYIERIASYKYDKNRRDPNFFGRFGREVSRNASRRLTNLGKNVMDGLGVDIEDRIRSITHGVTHDMVDSFKRVLQERLKSQPGKQTIEKLKEQAMEHFWHVPLKEISEDLERIYLTDILGQIPDTVSYWLKQDLFHQILDQQLERLWSLNAEKRIYEILDELGILLPVRNLSIKIVDGFIENSLDS